MSSEDELCFNRSKTKAIFEACLWMFCIIVLDWNRW